MPTIKESLVLPNAFVVSVLCVSFILAVLGFSAYTVFVLHSLLVVGMCGYTWGLARLPPIAFVVWWIVFIVGMACALYRPPGFHYPLLFSVEALHEGGKPFAQYLNFGKLLAGLLVFSLLLRIPLKQRVFTPQRRNAMFLIAIMVGGVLGLGFTILDMEIHIKPVQWILIFGAANLIATCMAEEAFMRLLLQREAQRLIQKFSQNVITVEVIPLLLTTLIFVLTHTAPTLEMTLVYGIAGFFYGLLYTLTKNVYYSIALHFLVNILHFSIFTYPLI